MTVEKPLRNSGLTLTGIVDTGWVLAAEGPLPVYLTFLLGLVCFGLIIIVPLLRGQNTKMTCSACGLSYRGRHRPCPHCAVWPCPDCGAVVRLGDPCAHCGADPHRVGDDVDLE